MSYRSLEVTITPQGQDPSVIELSHFYYRKDAAARNKDIVWMVIELLWSPGSTGYVHKFHFFITCSNSYFFRIKVSLMGVQFGKKMKPTYARVASCTTASISTRTFCQFFFPITYIFFIFYNLIGEEWPA